MPHAFPIPQPARSGRAQIGECRVPFEPWAAEYRDRLSD